MFKNVQPPLDWKWDDLRFVLAVAQTGSLSAAARLLETSHPTVFRRIRDFEAKLDHALFDRSASGYVPTPAGELVVAVARRMAADIDALDLQLNDKIIPIRDTLRLTCPDTIYFYVLGPVLAQFRRQFPEITIEMVVSNDFVNLQRREVDVAIRATERFASHLHSVKLHDVVMAVHAHIDNPIAHEKVPQLENSPWIGFDEILSRTGMAAFIRENNLEHKVIFRANSLLGACEAVRQNIGIGMIPCYAGEAYSEVVRLSTPNSEFKTGLWMACIPELKQKPAVRAFFEFAQLAFVPLYGKLTGEAAP